MAKRQIFYSFHFDNDVFRVQMVRQMGVIEGNEPVSKNTWETVKGNGNAAIEKWIDDNMKGKSCVVVLIGTDTSKRPWVDYEIKKAWKDGKGLVGVHIHNLSSMNAGKCTKGKNPFDAINFTQAARQLCLLATTLSQATLTATSARIWRAGLSRPSRCGARNFKASAA